MFTEHRRVEPSCDIEQMSNCGLVMLVVEEGLDVVHIKVTQIAEQVPNGPVCIVESLDSCVHLCAVTGGQDDDFTDVIHVLNDSQCLRHIGGSNGHLLE